MFVAAPFADRRVAGKLLDTLLAHAQPARERNLPRHDRQVSCRASILREEKLQGSAEGGIAGVASGDVVDSKFYVLRGP
ncbi:GNAT family N-acetyltransferase [Bradyrhizobium cosmicum]|uniref:GNAT family N-acetyltransferase n=1 Tax=Bradyrhizobium cosmicum TaxID=1404864 RepID=UPI001FCE96A1|nr:GNAT family N-acetyltransferase [Bradyrhizobium cosmicum]